MNENSNFRNDVHNLLEKIDAMTQKFACRKLCFYDSYDLRLITGQCDIEWRVFSPNFISVQPAVAALWQGQANKVQSWLTRNYQFSCIS